MALVVKSTIKNITATGLGPLLVAPAGTVVSSIVIQNKNTAVIDIEIAVDGESTYRTLYKNPPNDEIVKAPLMFEATDTIRYNCISIGAGEEVVIFISYAYDSLDPQGESIDVLSDVNTSTNPPVDGQSLVWDAATEKWIPETITGGSGSSTLAGLTDTAIPVPADDSVLSYNGTYWIAKTLYGTNIPMSSSNSTPIFTAIDDLYTGATAITGAVTDLQTDVSDLTTDVSDLTTLVDNNTQATTTNSTNIATNAAGIASNAGDIVILINDLNAVEAAIANFGNTVDTLNDVDFGTYPTSAYKLMAWYPDDQKWVPAILNAYNGIDAAATLQSAGDGQYYTLSYSLDTSGADNFINFLLDGNDDDLADMTFAYNTSGNGVRKMNGSEIRSLIKKLPEQIKNVSGATINRGTPVHVTGSIGQQAEVVVADATTNFPAHYIADEDIPDNSSGLGVAIGLIEDVDLTPFGDSASNYSEGDEVYLGASGGFTTTRPTGTNAVQHLGVILKVNTGSNKISGMLTGMGQVNSLPNLADGYVWIGDSNGVPQQVDSSTLGGGGGGSTTTINNNSNNRIITGSDTADTLEAEAKFTYDGTNVDVIGAGVTDGLRITGGNIGGAPPSIGLTTGGNFNRIQVNADLVLQNQTKIAFDTDPTNTYIAADTLNPENLNFYADSSLGFYPDDSLDVYTTSIGVNKVFTIASGVNSARVGIGLGATTGARELYVNGGIVCQEDFFDYAGTQSALTWKGETINLGTSAATTAGRLYYYTGTTWALADADDLNSASSLLGIALSASSNKGMLINGWYTIQGGATNGQLYMSPSAGLFTNTQPSTSGQYVRVVGHGLGGGLIRFNPSNDFYEVE